MIYEVLPIPATQGRNWGVYATFRYTGLPPKREISTMYKRDAVRFAQEMCEEHARQPARAYTWRWTVIDDDSNQWWKMNDFYAQEAGIRNPYREGGRVQLIDYGDGIELPVISVELWPSRRNTKETIGETNGKKSVRENCYP